MTVNRSKRSLENVRKEGCVCPEASEPIKTLKRKPTMLEMLEKLKLKVDKQLQKNRSLSPFRTSGQLSVVGWTGIFQLEYLGNVEYWRKMMNTIG